MVVVVVVVLEHLVEVVRSHSWCSMLMVGLLMVEAAVPMLFPLPPSPPPVLVAQDYESPATRVVGELHAEAIILCAMIAVLW